MVGIRHDFLRVNERVILMAAEDVLTEQRATEFLKAHQNADDIVVDTTTGLPFKAVYRVLDTTGNKRTVPAEFYFDL